MSTSRAEQARQRAEEEKKRLAALEQKQLEESGDLIETTARTNGNGNGAGQQPVVPTQPEPIAGEHSEPAPTGNTKTVESPAVETPGPAIGVTADRPIVEKRPKSERQGIDLRPVDRERVTRFELFCIQNRVATGKKRGLTLYARAGFLLLEQLIDEDKTKAAALLKEIGS